MQSFEHKGVTIIPHDTSLANILTEHRKIISQVKKMHGIKSVIPFYPPHCLVDTTLSIGELKKELSLCRIEVPILKGNLLVRPVSINGARLLPFPSKLIPGEPDNVPSGIIFGIINPEPNADDLRSIQHATEEAIKEEISSLGISAIKLRIFRLHNVRYKATENAGTKRPVTWELSSPVWVKCGD